MRFGVAHSLLHCKLQNHQRPSEEQERAGAMQPCDLKTERFGARRCAITESAVPAPPTTAAAAPLGSAAGGREVADAAGRVNVK